MDYELSDAVTTWSFSGRRHTLAAVREHYTARWPETIAAEYLRGIAPARGAPGSSSNAADAENLCRIVGRRARAAGAQLPDTTTMVVHVRLGDVLDMRRFAGQRDGEQVPARASRWLAVTLLQPFIKECHRPNPPDCPFSGPDNRV